MLAADVLCAALAATAPFLLGTCDTQRLRRFRDWLRHGEPDVRARVEKGSGGSGAEGDAIARGMRFRGGEKGVRRAGQKGQKGFRASQDKPRAERRRSGAPDRREGNGGVRRYFGHL